MKILFLTQYFPPEIGAASTRVFETAKYLKAIGHDISVLTTFPNYLMSKPIAKYMGRIYYCETFKGIKVYRSYTYTNLKKSLLGQFFAFSGFMLSSIFISIHLEPCDVLIATSPPFSVGISGLIISKLKRAKFVFEVRDLYPETAVQLGILKNTILINILRAVEHFLYSKADLLVALTNGILNYLKQLGNGDKSILITNGVNMDFCSQRSDNMPDIKINKGNKLVLLNVGILGRVHSLETIIDALVLLNNKDIVLYFVGGGVEEAKLKSKVRESKLKNVLFLENQKREHIPYFISKSDICLATTKKLKLTKGTLPVKVFEYMACGKPLVAAVHGEAADLIKTAKAGLIVEPENAKEMADAIVKLYQNPGLRRKMGKNGKSFVTQYYMREKLVHRLNTYLSQL